MSFGRIALAWVGVSLWLVVVDMVTKRWATGELDAIRARGPLGLTLLDAALITLFGALWFASLGSGAWWLVFGLLGLVVDLPLRLRDKGRATRDEAVADSEANVRPARPARLARPVIGTLITTVRYLGSGLILSLVL